MKHIRWSYIRLKLNMRVMWEKFEKKLEKNFTTRDTTKVIAAPPENAKKFSEIEYEERFKSKVTLLHVRAPFGVMPSSQAKK